MIKHRLFTKNRSTATHWYPARNGGLGVRVADLHPHHLAAIVDQYESEAAKVLRELGFTILGVASTRVQEFLRKHVPAWPAIKTRQRDMALNHSALYRELFVDKKYSVKREDFYPHQKVALDIENLVGKMVTVGFGSEKIGKTAPEFRSRYDILTNQSGPASPKEMLRLKIVQARVMLIEMEDLLSKL